MGKVNAYTEIARLAITTRLKITLCSVSNHFSTDFSVRPAEKPGPQHEWWCCSGTGFRGAAGR